MIIRLYKEEDVEVDLVSIVQSLNQVSKNIIFELGKEEFQVNEQYLHERDSFKYITSEIKDESNDDLFTLFISNKQYGDNFFFHRIDENKKYLLSLFCWEELTEYSKNTGTVYFILWILALYIDDSEERHLDDEFHTCIYNFARKKTEINSMIKNAIICDDCQFRLTNISDNNKERLFEELLNLLDEVKKLENELDIVSFWKSTQKEKVKIFFSYAHKDRIFLDEFKEYIKVFERIGLVERWDDNELVVGEKWNNTIKEKIYSADIIIFLISSTSLASDYIYNHELKIAFELKEMEESYVVPIIIKDCLWDMTEFREFQTLPIDSKAVNSWERREEAWTEVSRGLKKAIDNIINSKQKSAQISYSKNIDKGTSQKSYTNNKKQLVSDFLETYSRWWFNIPRIINWGSERAGFEDFSALSKKEVEKILIELENENIVKSKLSSKNRDSYFYKYNN